MMDLLNKISEAGIVLNLNNNDLKLYAENNNIDSNLICLIKENKKAIIEYLQKINSLDAINANYDSIDPIGDKSSYDVSSGQHRLWTLSQFEESNSSYNIHSHIYLDGTYNITNFKKAIISVIERHEILRTVFREYETGIIKQIILPFSGLGFTIGYEDYSKDENPKKSALNYIKKDSNIPFDLAKGPLLRVILLQLSKEEYILYYNMHHIISDGWSLDILSRDILTYYKHYAEGTSLSLPELRIQYKDYAALQVEQLKTKAFEKHKEYWLTKLSGYTDVLNLPDQKTRLKIKTNNGNTLRTFLPMDLSKKLKSYCKEFGGTMFMGVLTVWNILMFRYTEKKDILIGTTIAGRDHVDLENQIGIYFNTLVLRNKINPEDNFDESFLGVKDSILEDVAHQTYPFDLLVEDLNIKWDVSRNPLYDIMLSYHNTGENFDEIELSQERLDNIEVIKNTGAKLDLLVNFKEMGQYLYFDINYNTDLYDLSSVKVFMTDFKQLLNELLENSKENIGVIDFKKEVKQSLRSRNINKFKVVKK